jgi:hypothetical protein
MDEYNFVNDADEGEFPEYAIFRAKYEAKNLLQREMSQAGGHEIEFYSEALKP